jgi:hypothetical protein
VIIIPYRTKFCIALASAEVERVIGEAATNQEDANGGGSIAERRSEHPTKKKMSIKTYICSTGVMGMLGDEYTPDRRRR